VHIERTALDTVAISPDVVKQPLARETLAGVVPKILKQIPLLSRQMKPAEAVFRPGGGGRTIRVRSHPD
jgi:hypothetical protein